MPALQWLRDTGNPRKLAAATSLMDQNMDDLPSCHGHRELADNWSKLMATWPHRLPDEELKELEECWC